MTGDSEVGHQAVSIELSDGERHSFARHVKPVFDRVVFWINPAFGKQECAHVSGSFVYPKGTLAVIAQLLEHGGGRAATIRHHSKAPEEDGAAQKLNGVLVRGIPQMARHISRFYFGQSGLDKGSEQRRATHVITPDTHFGEYQACVKAGVHVVTRLWVERCLASGLQYVERYYSAHADDILSGIVVTATQMPKADRETLLASVMALGGQWREKMRADVTHLVLMKDLGPKYEFTLKHPELGIRAILPHWFKESLNLLRCVPHEPYVFPNPPMLEGRTAACDTSSSSSKATLAVPSGETHNGNAYELPKPSVAFMGGYRVAIDTQLLCSLSEGAYVRLERRLTEAGAIVCKPLEVDQSRGRVAESMVADWNSVDILVCQYRSGYDYSKASRLGKLVGTFAWLYQAFLSEQLTVPTLRLLHYPVPAVVVGGMDRMVITISHYTGASREYLVRLITALGARYTAKMTRDNTHLVTAQPEGRKYAAAVQWNVDIVNHLWVEQCYQRWKLLTVSHPNFTYFPDLPVLNSMVGDTEVRVDMLKGWVEAPQGATSFAEWSDMDLLGDSDLEPTAEVDTDESSSEMKSVGDSADELGGGAQAGEGAQQVVLGQRRHTSRAAAMAASKSLGEMMQAVNTFEKDMRRERLYKHRKSQAGARERGKEKENVEENAVKRARTDCNVRIMFTSVRATEQQERLIASMGGEIVNDATQATHLVCVEIKRTLKMLMALASGRVNIVSLTWLELSLAQRRWVSMRPADRDPLAAKCHVVDPLAEKKWSFRLEDSIQRASRRRLLEGVTVFVTPQSEPPLKVLRPLIEIAGGEAVDSLAEPRLRALISASVRMQRSGSAHDTIPPLLVVSCREDSHMWPMFRPALDKHMAIYATEVLLTGLLRQQILHSDDELGRGAG
ncbi:regulator of Ty1 Transposition [Coemansia sp. BCRC 34301]|nr:regulator of Ty1 Transposition [Coemansia sp. BCRC 34301]